MELEIENTEVVSSNEIQVEVPDSIEVTEGEKDYEVSVVKKEYTIIGDSIFIPSMYEDAPPWLKEFIDTTINVAVNNRDQSLIDRMEAILALMDYVPKNQYTEQINQIVSEDGIINSRIATLNSNLTDALSSTNATIAEINLTYASKDEAAAIATNVITASLSGNGEIGSALIQLQEAYADLESTTAQSINMLESVMEGEINGNATAMETIRTYVGIDEAGAGTGTGLSAYLEASDGTIGGADSQLANTIRVTAEGVESKWAYNSIVNINGVYRKSGFGLTANNFSGGGTKTNPYTSEFWIDATKLRFTNSANTGRTAPFTIDASGTTPQIKFNGVVEFSNVNGVPQSNQVFVQTTVPTSGMIKGDMWINTSKNNEIATYNGSSWIITAGGNKTYSQSSAPTGILIAGDLWINTADNNKYHRWNGSSWIAYLPDPAKLINSGTTTIDGGKITAASVTAAQIKANSVSADRLLSTSNNQTVWAGGGLVSSNFNGNPHGNIGNPTSGFRLSSDANGTSANPNIWGAYIKGSSIEGGTITGTTLSGVSLSINDIKVRSYDYPNNFGPINSVNFKKTKTRAGSYSITSDTFVGPGYSSGFHSRRISSSESKLIIKASVDASTIYKGGDMYVPLLPSIYLEVVVDGVIVTLESQNYISKKAPFSWRSTHMYTPPSNFQTLYIKLYGVLTGAGDSTSSAYDSEKALEITLHNGL